MACKKIYLIAWITIWNTQADFLSLKNIFSSFSPKEQEQLTTYEHYLDSHGTLEIKNNNGSITVKTWDQNKAIIEITQKGTSQEIKDVTLETHATDDYISVAARHAPNSNIKVDYTIQVPRKIKIKLTNSQGDIKLEQIHGPLSVFNMQGTIYIKNASNSVEAKTGTGNIFLSHTALKAATPISLETEHGAIKLAVPEESCAYLKAKTLNGTISCALYVTMKSRTTKLNEQVWEHIKRDVEGSIGTGGARISLYTVTGAIAINTY